VKGRQNYDFFGFKAKKEEVVGKLRLREVKRGVERLREVNTVQLVSRMLSG